MTRKRRRMIFVGGGLLALFAAAGLVLAAFQENLTYFYEPRQVMGGEAPTGRMLRLGGLVEEDSLERRADGVTVAFRVTDLDGTVPVTYRGILPDLFREGQGVVAQGILGEDGVFVASEVLAKHDETYMPREVADALKKSGQWKGDSGSK